MMGFTGVQDRWHTEAVAGRLAAVMAHGDLPIHPGPVGAVGRSGTAGHSRTIAS
jgi:hypothetical protein